MEQLDSNGRIPTYKVQNEFDLLSSLPDSKPSKKIVSTKKGLKAIKALTDLQKEFAVVHWDNLEPKDKIEKICYFVSEFWHIHPFREGNTRTSAMMLYFLTNLYDKHSRVSIYFVGNQ